MSRDLEKAFLEQGRRLFELCRLYIDGSYRPEEKDSLIKEIEVAFDKWEEVDNRALFEEITANLEEPMSEQQRERYCFSLLTPFGEYSSTLYPKWLIDKTKESINILQGRGEDIDYLEKQIDSANRKAGKYKDLAFSIGKLKRNEVESIFFEFAHIVSVEYAHILDAAFVMHGLDLKRLQEKCCVFIKQYMGGEIDREMRALDIGYYIGSEALAEEYLSRLPQEQSEPQQSEPQQGEQTAQQEQQPGTQQAAAPESNKKPQQGCQQELSNSGEVVLPDVLNTQKTRAVFDEAISRGWMKENVK